MINVREVNVSRAGIPSGVVNLTSVYQLFKEKMRGFELIPLEEDVQQRVAVKPYQLRILSCNVPDYWFITVEDEYGLRELGLYRVLVLTEDICLADFDKCNVPMLRVAGINVIACLPFWIYLTEEFLKKYSIYVADVDKSLAESLLKWAMKVELPGEETISGRYLRDVMELMSSWNTESILDVIDKFE